jgi:hypothetical protein
MTASESIRLRGLAGTVDKTGVRFLRGLREAFVVAARRDRGLSDMRHADGRHASAAASFVELACILRGSEASPAVDSLAATRPVPLSHRFAAAFLRRVGPPNKAPEPTPLLVTIRACARLAPSSVVAHL